jgi:cyclopropane fatty-acyl-phospholipid synthase-like methyltransferase
MLDFHLNGQIDVSSRSTEFINRSVEWIASRFNVAAGKKIADFGCGPGLYTTKLAEMDADVIGIDFSNTSIQYAQQIADSKKLPIKYINQNYLDFETNDRFHLIVMIMCDFCVLSPDQRKRMLRKFHNFLSPDGFLLFDVYSLSAFNKQQETAVYQPNLLDGFWSPNKYYGFLNRFKYEKEKVVLDKYTIIEANRTQTIYNWMQYFSPETLKEELADCSFTIGNFYSDVAGSPFDSDSDEFAVVAARSN